MYAEPTKTIESKANTFVVTKVYACYLMQQVIED